MNVAKYFDSIMIEAKFQYVFRLLSEIKAIVDIMDGELTFREMSAKHGIPLSTLTYLKDQHFPGWRKDPDILREERRKKEIRRENARQMREHRIQMVHELRESGKTYREISKATGWSLGSIGDILNNRKR